MRDGTAERARIGPGPRLVDPLPGLRGLAELVDPPQLVTFDQSDAALELVELGKIAAVVAHDPHLCGYLAVDRLAYFHAAGALARPAEGKGHIYVPTTIVRPGEVAEFRASLKQAATSL